MNGYARLGLLAFLAFPAAFAVAQSGPPDEAVDEDTVSTEEGTAIVDRVRLYLQRHGENGVIDPVKRLRQVAAVHAELTARAKRGADPTSAEPAWTSLGPTNGAGRMTSLAPHPTAMGTVYAGAAGGGVWKTTDGGSTWIPLTETLNDLSVGAVALAPSAPNIVYVGSGEGGYAIDFIPGNGFFRSTDGGATWTVPASVVASMFYRISVHPANPGELLAGTNQGMLRSTDGGNSWATTIPASAGDVADIVRHPSNPAVVWAGVWCKQACSSSSRLVQKSTDGGVTWAPSSIGLPAPGSLASPFHTRPALAVSPSNPLVLYLSTAIIESPNTYSHVYRSSDGGTTWTELSSVHGNSNGAIRAFLGGQGWYDNTIVVSPLDPNVVFAGGVSYIRTTDGGSSWTFPSYLNYPHVDAHDIRYQGSTLWVANDGGIWTSTDHGASFTERNAGLVTRQYYALALDPSNPQRILGGMQDNGTNQRIGAGTSWRFAIGGDGFECGVHPTVPEVAYGTLQGGVVYRSKKAGDPTSPDFFSIGPPYRSGEGGPFLSLLTLDPSSPSTVYTASNRVWRSTDGGDTWFPLPTMMTDGSSWGSGTISSIARTGADPSLLMVSQAYAGKVVRSTDSGNTWKSASGGLPDLAVNNLEIDPKNAAVAYAAIATQSGTSVYRTTDGAATWQVRSSGLPAFAAQVVRVDPNDSNVVYCGTDVGVYRSGDQGANWSRFGSGLPASSVHDLRISADGSQLRLATHGRGIWELQVPISTNHPPVSTLSAPTGAVTVNKGATVSFSGTVSDPDPGDSVTAAWTTTDTWRSITLPAGASTFSHTFPRAGVFPVSLSARDSHGARGAAVVRVTVTDPAGSCATPAVLPPSGPFPITVTMTNELAPTSGASDPTPACLPWQPYRGLWLEFTPAVTGSYEISTCGASIDTTVSVWTGPACGPFVAVAGGCNDDAPAGSVCAGTKGSSVTVSLAAGQTYRIFSASLIYDAVGTVPFTVSLASASSAPRVTSLSPWSGPAAGGTSVVIQGFSFLSGATVSFGGTSVPATFVMSTMLRAVSPAHAAGDVDVEVRNPGGAAGTGSKAFTYFGASAESAFCVPDASTLCLLGNRFLVRAEYADYSGNHGQGKAMPLTPDTGTFWFFNAANVEAVVKMVSFCGGGSNNVAVYAGGLTDVDVTLHVTDMRTGLTKDYRNPLGTGFTLIRDGPFACPAGLTGELPPVKAAAKADSAGEIAFVPAAIPEPAPEAACVANATTLCLMGERFQVRAAYRDYGGNVGTGQAAPLTPDTGTFWFFNPANVEAVVKMVSFCGGGSKNVAVYAGGLTDLGVTLTVTDIQTGLVKTYTNPLGTGFTLIRDGPFACP